MRPAESQFVGERAGVNCLLRPPVITLWAANGKVLGWVSALAFAGSHLCQSIKGRRLKSRGFETTSHTMKRVIAFGCLGEMLACSMSKFHWRPRLKRSLRRKRRLTNGSDSILCQSQAQSRITLTLGVSLVGAPCFSGRRSLTASAKGAISKSSAWSRASKKAPVDARWLARKLAGFFVGRPRVSNICLWASEIDIPPRRMTSHLQAVWSRGFWALKTDCTVTNFPISR